MAPEGRKVPSGKAVGGVLDLILNSVRGLEGLTFLPEFLRLEAADSSQVRNSELSLDLVLVDVRHEDKWVNLR